MEEKRDIGKERETWGGKECKEGKTLDKQPCFDDETGSISGWADFFPRENIVAPCDSTPVEPMKSMLKRCHFKKGAGYNLNVFDNFFGILIRGRIYVMRSD